MGYLCQNCKTFSETPGRGRPVSPFCWTVGILKETKFWGEDRTRKSSSCRPSSPFRSPGAQGFDGSFPNIVSTP